MKSTRPKRKRPKKSADPRRTRRRQAILDAAARRFARFGFDETEMDDIAAAVSVAKGTVYLYFASKRELFFACVDEGMRRMQEAVQSAAQKSPEPFDKIAGAIGAYLVFFDAHPHFVELLIQERAIFKDRIRPTYFEFRDANRGPWRELYQGLAAEGRIRSDVSIESILDTIGSLLYGTMFTNHFAGRKVSLEEQHRAILAVVFEGILPTGNRARWPKVNPECPPRSTT